MVFSTYIWILLGATGLLAYLSQKYITEKFNIPSLAVFIIIGIVLGGSGFSLYTKAVYAKITFIPEITLGIIAFMVGSEFSPRILKQLGKPILFIATGEVLLCAALVSWGVFQFAHVPLYTALILGAVASITAPAATLYTIESTKSRGTLSSTMLGVITVDNILSMVLFSFIGIFAGKILTGSAIISVSNMFLTALTQLGLSALFGILGGVCFSVVARTTNSSSLLFTLAFMSIVVLTGISKYFHISQTLVLLIFGVSCAFINDKVASATKSQLEHSYNLLLPILFILLGSMFSWKHAVATFSIGLIYTITRALGKYLGALAGAKLGRMDRQISKTVGLGLFSQAGIIFGLAAIIEGSLGSGAFGKTGKAMSLMVGNILIWTTLITEIIGPSLTRWALVKAGESGRS